MAINRSQERDFLLPGLAGITGKFSELPARYKDIFWQGTSKMSAERTAEAAFMGLAQLKAEGAATEFDNTAGERFVYNIIMNSIGLGFAITREALEDNLYKAQFGPSSMGLMESFMQTKDILCANVLNSGNVYQPTIGGDGVAMVATNHPIDNGTYANTPATQLDFNESSLEYTLNAIRYFPDQKGLIKNIQGRKLVVPVALQWAAERMLRTEYRVGTNNNDRNAIVSTGAMPEGYVVNEFLTSPFAWFVLTNEKGLVYYQRTPFEMDLQVDPTTGNLMVIGFERWGAGYISPRGIFGNYPLS